MRLMIFSASLLGAGIRAATKSLADCCLLRPNRAGEGMISTPQEIVGVADELETHALSFHPDTTIFDASSIDLLQLFQQLGHHRLSFLGHLVVLTPLPDEEQCFWLMRYGIADYIGYGLSPEHFCERIKQVAQGIWLLSSDAFLAPQPAGTTYEQSKPDREDQATSRSEPDRQDQPIAIQASSSPLTERELTILTYVAQGLRNKDVGKVLEVSDQTVKNHMTSIMKKLCVNDRTSAVVYAIREQWINPAEVFPTCPSASVA